MLRPVSFREGSTWARRSSESIPIGRGSLALRWSFLQSEVRDAQAQGLQASIGIGVWSVIAGTVLILAGGLLAQRRS